MLTRWSEAPDASVTVANRLYGAQAHRFEAPFISLTQSHYAAPLLPVDFAGAPEQQRSLINQWVKGKTEQRIEELIPPNGVSRDTRLALVNVITFAAGWALPFFGIHTRQASFDIPRGLWRYR